MVNSIDSTRSEAAVVLESGDVFRGRAFGHAGSAVGEVVFNTSLTGYQEILTDPSYAGQIVVMTAPLIGNTGVNAEDAESAAPFCRGLVIRELARLASNWRSEGDLDGYLQTHGIVGIEGVDTRALTRALREHGAQRGIVAASATNIDEALATVRSSPAMEGQDLCSVVSCKQPYQWSEPAWTPPDLGEAPRTSPASPPFRVVAYDYGVKHHILRDLVGVGCNVTVVPATTSAADVLAMDCEGIFLSNGPGDPAAVDYAVDTVKELAASGRIVFGICLGHQILSLALGAKTFKLRFGHHGGNHPVKDLSTGKVEITSQNHGFAVDATSLPAGVECTHINLYDQTCEGIRASDGRVFGIQYHPEASPGPHDAHYLFDQFAELMRAGR